MQRCVIGLAPRVFRETPAGVMRFLKAEGGSLEAARLERANTFAGLDSATAATTPVTRVPFTADAKGVVHIPLDKAGPVMLRSAYVSRKAGGATREWDVSRTTFVFNVGTKR